MMRTPILAVVFASLVMATAFADDPKQQAEDLANALASGVHAAARTTPTSDAVPGYTTGTPPEAAYYRDTPGMEADGATASYTPENAATVRDSMAQRPATSDAELAAATAEGFSAQYGAPSTVTDFTGSYGDCTSALVGGAVVASCGADTYCISGDCSSATRDFDDNLPEAASALKMMGSISSELDPSDLSVFGGDDLRCKTAFGGARNCCKDSGVLTNLFGCPEEAKVLAAKQDEGLCTYVGTYCSRKVLGVCLAKKRSYCCFESKLSRLIQEQGRVQLRKDWGSARRPDCDGFSVAEFQRLNFAAMDLREYYEEAVASVNPPSDAAILTDLEAQIAAYYN